MGYPMAKTIDEMVAEAKAKDAEIAALKSQLASAGQTMKIEAVVSDYSKGTVSIRGINRFPISLFLPQIQAVKAYFNSPEFNTWLNSPDTANRIRCSAVAHEYAVKMGTEWPTDKKTPGYDEKVTAYKAAYDKGYAMAKADTSLVASTRVKTPKTAVAR